MCIFFVLYLVQHNFSMSSCCCCCLCFCVFFSLHKLDPYSKWLLESIRFENSCRARKFWVVTDWIHFIFLLSLRVTSTRNNPWDAVGNKLESLLIIPLTLKQDNWMLLGNNRPAETKYEWVCDTNLSRSEINCTFLCCFGSFVCDIFNYLDLEPQSLHCFFVESERQLTYWIEAIITLFT